MPRKVSCTLLYRIAEISLRNFGFSSTQSRYKSVPQAPRQFVGRRQETHGLTGLWSGWRIDRSRGRSIRRRGLGGEGFQARLGWGQGGGVGHAGGGADHSKSRVKQ